MSGTEPVGEMTLLDSVTFPGEFDRVALLSDVHGNLPALEACLADVFDAEVDAIFFLGDLTWGPQPREVLDRTQSIGLPTGFVAGNAERAVVELANGSRQWESATGDWLVERHDRDGVQRIAAFPAALTVRTRGIGTIRLCHGSPRSDIELLTPATPTERIIDATRGLDTAAFAHGHTHLQYQREVNGLRIIAPGSVGIPYDAAVPGARWALVADDVTLRTSPYDIELAISAARAVDYPGLANYEKYLRTPPTLDEIVEDAEGREFAD